MAEGYVSRVGRKNTLYLPKEVVRRLGIREGDRVVMKIEDERLILEFISDPLTLALRSGRWAKTTVEEFERESESEQEGLYG